MGSLRSRGDGVWQARVYAGLDPVSGKQRYTVATIHAKSETIAERELRKLERKVLSGRIPRGTTAVSLGEQLDDWCATKKPRLAPGTRLGYESAINLCEPLRPIPLGKLTARDLDGLYAELARQGKATSTIRKAHLMISGALAQAVRHEMLERNVALNAEPPAVRGKPTRPPTIEELTTLLEAADDDFRTFLFVAATTGARRGELAALRWRDVDLEKKTITVRHSVAEDRDSIVIKDTKSHQVRAVALDDETVAVLTAHRDRCRELARGCGIKLTGERFVFSPRPGTTPAMYRRCCPVASPGYASGRRSMEFVCTTSDTSPGASSSRPASTSVPCRLVSVTHARRSPSTSTRTASRTTTVLQPTSSGSS